jgi:tetratricopeptide (TPR) repeat protein/tRNA A-37 threonylcarbamoyl transferase component Bud32
MPDLTGKTLGKYRLIERLGRGGMAEVYRAYQPGLERDVAVKVMHSYLADDEGFVGRFKREARAVAALHHPHVVQVYDFDVEDDVYYMVMEYVGGETLKARLQRFHAEGRRMGPGRVVPIFRALCDALDYAHAEGCIHRDVKPANVLFDGERLVLTDFGLATIVGGKRLTVTGTIMGTPAYMSPEQSRGEPGGVVSDVYSLGVILYEMVTGRVPYDADTPLAIVMKHLNEPLPLPSRVASDVPPAVERVILKALAKAPEDRYQSAGALAGALGAAVSGEGEAAVSPSAPPGTIGSVAPASRPPSRRRWVGWALAGAAAVALVALVALGALVLPRLGGEKTEVASVTSTAPAAAAATEAASPVALATPGEQAVIFFDQGVTALEDWDLERAVDEFTDAIEESPGYAGAYHLRGVAYRELGMSDEAEADLTRAIELAPGLAEAYHDRGRLYLHFTGRTEDALEDLSAAIDLGLETAEVYADRGHAYLWLSSDHALALGDARRAIELDPSLGEAWALQGEVLFIEEEYEEAVDVLSGAVERMAHEPWVWEMLGTSYYWLGELEESLTAYEEAIALSPGNLFLYYLRADVLVELGDLEGALEDYDRVILLDPQHAGAYMGRGRVYVELERYDEALEDFTAAVEGDFAAYQWPHFAEDDPRIDRASLYLALGMEAEAEADLDAAVDEWEGWHVAHYHRGLFYRDVGRAAEALEDFRVAWENAPDREWRDAIEDAMEGLAGGS